MENNEIMNNIEDVIEMNEANVVDENNGIGLIGGALLITGVAVAGYAAYKGVKWVAGKIKAKKAAKAAASECIEADYKECDEDVEA